MNQGRRSILHRFWPIVLVTIAGCSLLGRHDGDDVAVYQLELPQGAEHPGGASAGPACGILLISSPLSAPGLSTTNMSYTREHGRLESYAKSRWVDTPARMFAPLLLQALSSSGFFQDVLTSPAPVDASLRLQTEILSLKQVFDGGASVEQFAIRASLFDLKRRQVIANGLLKVEEPANTADARGGVEAANRAAAKLLDQLKELLGTALMKHRPCSTDSTRPVAPG